MNAPYTPFADSLLRARYGLPDDFDLDSVPIFHLEIIGDTIKRKAAEAAAREAEAKAKREAEEAALRPPEIVARFTRTADYLAGDRRVAGIASTGAIDSHSQVLCPGGADLRLPVPLLVAHDAGRCIGSVEGAQIDAEGKIYIWANVDARCDADTWRKIQRKKLGCFSVASDQKTCAAPVKIKGINYYFFWRPKEISICEVGANHLCLVTEIFPPISETQPSDETAAIGQADLAQSVAELTNTLRLPVKPLYDKDGKLIGAQRVDKAFEQLEARLAAVESRPAALYRGIWSADEGYYEVGELVTCKGSLWACRASTRSKPGEDASWKLTVKQGRA